MKKNLLIILFGFIISISFFGIAHATSTPKQIWCHVEPNGNQETLELPQQALEQAGHVDANGNPLHAGDHAGECITITPTVDPSTEPTTEPTIEVTPVSPTASPSASPTPTTVSNSGGAGDGKSDGRSDGKSDNRSGQPIINKVGWK